MNLLEEEFEPIIQAFFCEEREYSTFVEIPSVFFDETEDSMNLDQHEENPITGLGNSIGIRVSQIEMVASKMVWSYNKPLGGQARYIGFSSQLHSFGGGGDSSEDDLAVLPRHTKVVVTGNNRTKSVLVGLQGVVKKAVGLGGWHWLILTNGIEVKLQRNALSVLEGPTGLEDDDDLECENVWSGLDMASDDTQKSYRSRHRHKTIAQKTMSRTFSYESQSKGSPARCATKVDLSKLEMTTLWRYWRYFNLVDAIPNPSKEELVDVVQRHFMSQWTIEKRMMAAKCLEKCWRTRTLSESVQDHQPAQPLSIMEEEQDHQPAQPTVVQRA